MPEEVAVVVEEVDAAPAVPTVSAQKKLRCFCISKVSLSYDIINFESNLVSAGTCMSQVSHSLHLSLENVVHVATLPSSSSLRRFSGSCAGYLCIYPGKFLGFGITEDLLARKENQLSAIWPTTNTADTFHSVL